MVLTKKIEEEQQSSAKKRRTEEPLPAFAFVYEKDKPKATEEPSTEKSNTDGEKPAGTAEMQFESTSDLSTEQTNNASDDNGESSDEDDGEIPATEVVDKGKKRERAQTEEESSSGKLFFYLFPLKLLCRHVDWRRYSWCARIL